MAAIGGKVNAANLNFQGLDAANNVVAGDVIIVSKGSGPNERALVSQLPGGVPDPLLLDDGLVGTPSYSFTSNPTTGVFLDAANDLGIAANGKDRGICIPELS